MIDTHCHIDDPVYQSDFDAFIHAQQSAGVERILVPGIDSTSIETVKQVCQRYPDYLLPAIGLHPENVNDHYKEELQALHQALCEPYGQRYIAIGEIGLDYHFDTTYKNEQQDALHRQLQWAVERDLPVMIHSRDATEDTLNILAQYPSLQGVMHCFSGSRETAERIVGMGLYLGIGGVITFKNCHLSEHLRTIPLDRLVLETDAPYMAPVPFRGQTNESRFMVYVADTLAGVYNTSKETIIEQTTANATLLFKLNHIQSAQK
ncbi:MAG: TatD family hydrolase [Paludibacteraceae bacterium]|nr:TatD family hydrolase [Paludibacteraceae bacterium]